ncbi:MAG: hypothetical protein QM733_04120 [Ilumatobacteraceae bacterium]
MGTSFKLARHGLPAAHVAGLDALILGIGGVCLASGPTAAAVRGYPGFALRPPFDVMIERGRSVNRAGHRVHTTLALPQIDRARLCGLPVLSGTRTIVDLAAVQPPERLRTALDAAIEAGDTSPDFLFRRIADLRDSGRYGLPMLVDVLVGHELDGGGRTWLEAEVLRLIAGAGLPAPVSEVVLARRGRHDVRVDFHWPGTNVVLEALGYRWHRTERQMQVDAERMNALQLAGHVVLQCTYRAVAAGLVTVLTELREALTLGRAA